MTNNRVVFRVENKNSKFWVWNMTSYNLGTWSSHKVSEKFDTYEEAVAEAKRQAQCPEFNNWMVSFYNIK